MTIHSFLSPSKSRTPLQDHSASLLSDADWTGSRRALPLRRKRGAVRASLGALQKHQRERARVALRCPGRTARAQGQGRGIVAGRRSLCRKQLNLTFRPQSEEQQRIGDLIQQGAEEGLEVRHIDGKGRGVFASRSFRKGQFVVEYHGDLLETKDAKKREEEYGRNPATGCYMYYFQYLSKTYCVDATKETQRLGRLVNHSKAGNCQTKLHGINGKPHLILVASRDIEKGEELLYDYGDRSKESIAAHPWLKY
ncbi:lysine methyltransferase 5Ab [Anguilla anguilla]|uniref:lysine methyltransferase 5Ab n=1 Tax=Anguilla anguilla TaxID=7936 RepID=UPI0015AC8AD1|nr:lysine methyltransferase 5Ab [Anguilla anguilla]